MSTRLYLKHPYVEDRRPSALVGRAVGVEPATGAPIELRTKPHPDGWVEVFSQDALDLRLAASNTLLVRSCDQRHWPSAIVPTFPTTDRSFALAAVENLDRIATDLRHLGRTKTDRENTRDQIRAALVCIRRALGNV